MQRKLITFGSWEDRFATGVDRELGSGDGGYRQVVVFYYDGYAERTAASRDKVERSCRQHDVHYRSLQLRSTESVACWKKMFGYVDSHVAADDDVVVDISTMPRDVIWSLFWMLERKGVVIKYVYHSPSEYGSDWLSRDPRPPRMIYKLSGEVLPSEDTVLLIILGYDVRRAMRLIRWYDPNRLVLGVQSGNNFVRNQDMMRKQLTQFGSLGDSKVFAVDAFSEDSGRAAIQDALCDVGGDENVILSSLGSKLTAVSLYEIQRNEPRFGLSYTPANEFSDNYSVGIGRRYGGTIEELSR